MTITLESNCPRCGSRNVRPSRQTNLLTGILRVFLLDSYRCRNCFRRFFGPRAIPAAVDTVFPPLSGKSRAAAN